MLKQLVEKCYVQKPLDMFSMTAGKLTGLDQSGPKLASIICRGIEQAKDVQLGELLLPAVSMVWKKKKPGY